MLYGGRKPEYVCYMQLHMVVKQPPLKFAYAFVYVAKEGAFRCFQLVDFVVLEAIVLSSKLSNFRS